MGISLQNLVLMDHEGTKVQFLDSSLESYKSRKGHNEFSFVSDQDIDASAMLLGSLKTKQFGLIVWMDRAKADEMLKRRTPDGVKEEHAGALRSLHLALQEVMSTEAHHELKGVDLSWLKDNLDALFEEAM